MNFLYNICSNTLWLNLKLWCRYQVKNRSLIPKKGKMMIISNHQSNIDAGLLGASINRDLKFPAKIELFKNPFMSFFLKSYGAFPIKRGIVDINSYRNIKKVLENKNGALSIFPEGTRDEGKLVKGKSGAAKIAKSHDPIIVPVGISGTLHLKGLFRVFNPSGNITVTIGNPFKLKKIGHNDDKEYFDKLTDEMMVRISKLLPEEKRGYYSRSNDNYTLTEEI